MTDQTVEGMRKCLILKFDYETVMKWDKGKVITEYLIWENENMSYEGEGK